MNNIRRTALAWIFAVATAATVALLDRPSMGQPLVPREIKAIRQPTFDIEYQIGEGSRATQVDLWYTDDKSQSWTFYGSAADLTKPISFTAKHEGLYGFTVIARNKAGASANNPRPGAEPTFWCFVDWHRPQVQITAPVPPAGEGGGPGQLYLKPKEPLAITYTALDDNLTDKPICIEYRLANDNAWKEIAANQPYAGKYLWRVPDSVKGPFLLRVTAEDQAGNVGPATTLREIEIVRQEERGQLTGGAKPAGPDSGDVVAPHALPMVREAAPPLANLPTSMPATPDLDILGIHTPVQPPVSIRYPGEGSVAMVKQPGQPVESKTGGESGPPKVSTNPVDPPAGTPLGGVSEQDAIGIFVLQYTAPEPASPSKLEPTIKKLRAALKPLIDGGMIAAPIGVSMQPLADSAVLVKVVKLYAVIPPANRKPDQAALIQQMAMQNVGSVDGTVLAMFDKAAAGQPPPGPAVAGGGDGGVAGKVGGSTDTAPRVGPPAPDIKGETPKTVAVPIGPGLPPGVSMMPVAYDPAKRPQPAVETPESLAGGRQDMELVFGPKQPDLKIAPPPPAAPVPMTPGIIEQPKPPAAPIAAVDPIVPAPLAEKVSSPPAPPGVTPAVAVVGPEPGPAAITTPRPSEPPAGDARPASAGMVPPVPPRFGASDPVAAAPAGMPVPGAPVATGPLTPGVTIAPSAGGVATPTGGGDSPLRAATVTPTTAAPPVPESANPPTLPAVTAKAVRHIDSEKLDAAMAAFKAGLAAYAANDRAKAAACYQQAIDNDPEMVEAYINLAGVQMLGQEYDKAELTYLKAVSIQPDHPKALFGLGSVQMLRKKPQLARETLDKLLRIRATDAAAWILYGDACLGVTEKAAAVSAWQEAARLAPANGPIAKLAQDRLARFGSPKN